MPNQTEPSQIGALPRTRLAYVHLRNLLTDAKRDRSARVSGYVAIWLPEEFLVLYLQRGELRLVAEATSTELDACRQLLPGLIDLFPIVRISEFSPADGRSKLTYVKKEGLAVVRQQCAAYRSFQKNLTQWRRVSAALQQRWKQLQQAQS